MSTISEKLTQLNTIKGDIKTAINNKGGEVGNDFSTYATAINNLSTGGSSEYIYPEFFKVRTNNNTDYSYLFANISFGFGLFNESFIQFIENLDTSKVTSMRNTFNSISFSTTSRKNFDLSKWDTKNVTEFSGVFSSSQIESVSFAGCVLSKVYTIQNIFYYCSKLKTVDFTGCDTSKVINMDSAFAGCSILMDIIGYLDLSNLTNGFYPASYSNPVKNCKSLETLYLKNIYKDCTMNNNSKWSINLGSTKVKDSCLLYIIDQLPNLYEKGITNNTNIVLTLPPTNTLTQEQVQVAIDRGWQVANVNY